VFSITTLYELRPNSASPGGIDAAVGVTVADIAGPIPVTTVTSGVGLRVSPKGHRKYRIQ